MKRCTEQQLQDLLSIFHISYNKDIIYFTLPKYIVNDTREIKTSTTNIKTLKEVLSFLDQEIYNFDTMVDVCNFNDLRDKLYYVRNCIDIF